MEGCSSGLSELLRRKGVGGIEYQLQYCTESGKTQRITVSEGANLLDILRERQVMQEAACNGMGICGKCRVKVVKGSGMVTEEERRLLTSREIADGIRLACKVYVTEDMEVRVQDAPAQIQTLGLTEGRMGEQEESTAAEYGIAVDLGSTTLAAVLTDCSGMVLAQASAVNSQRAYGADVLSRIQASVEGKSRELKACISRDLENLFRTLIRQKGENVHISGIAIAGNTAMLHLLRGYSCKNLGQAPFEPVSLKLECLDYEELFADIAECRGSKVYLLPGMSAFTGADITAGLYSSGFWQMPEQETAFFVDLGTNAEMAFGSRDGFVTASAPAGPAFEGGRLSCGVPGIPGAVSQVSYLYHRVRVQTVGQKKPCGICGTGALDAAAALRKEGLMDADGLLEPQLFETGMVLARREDGSSICLTQADIREIQMAKAAVRAGIEILMKRYREIYGKTGTVQADRIYLAGGFGYYLSVETAAVTGLFPAEWKDRAVSCGNTSLRGAAAFLCEPSCRQELEKIREKNQGIRLESQEDFQEIYMQSMGFPVC